MVIYQIENLVNGKLYVGKSAEGVKRRFWKHLSRAFAEDGYEMPLYIDMREFGRQSFRVTLLEEVQPNQSLDEREQFWIHALNTKVPNGYNLTDGGSGTIGYKHTVEDKAVMRALKSGKFDGVNNPFFGKNHSKKQIEKWKRERAGRKLTSEWKTHISETRQRKPVINIDTGQVFESARHACRFYGKSPDSGTAGTIAKVCQKLPKYKTVMGYRFEYYDPQIHDNTVPSLEIIKEGVTTIQ